MTTAGIEPHEAMFRALVDLRDNRANREALNRLLCQLKVIAARSPNKVTIPAQDQEDVVYPVALKVLQKLDDLPIDKGSRVCSVYVQTMLANLWLTQNRKKRPATAVPDGTVWVPPRLVVDVEQAATEDANALELLMAAEDAGAAASVLEALDPVVEQAIADTQDRYRAGRREAWLQLQDLVMGRCTLREIVADAVALGDQSRAEFTTTRNRIFKQHERLRVALADMIDRMEHDGRLDREGAAYMRQLSSGLIRCQRSS
jgi:hypothetical protein